MILLQQTRDFFLQVVLWKCGGAILHKYQFLRKSCFNLPDQFHQKHTDLGWGWWQCWRTLDERVHTAPTDCQSYYLPSPPEMPWAHTQKSYSHIMMLYWLYCFKRTIEIETTLKKWNITTSVDDTCGYTTYQIHKHYTVSVSKRQIYYYIFISPCFVFIFQSLI